MITRLDLSNGHWINVKDRQTLGDEMEVHEYAFRGIQQDGTTIYDIKRHQAATAAVRIKSWSVSADDGTVIPWPGPGTSLKDRIQVLRRLFEEQTDEIFAAITKHINALAAAKAEAKKETQDGATDSEQSSPSAR